MNRNAIALTMIILSFAANIALGQESGNITITSASSSDAWGMVVKDVQIFTHLVRIPADSDQSTIRFEGAKMVRVPTRITYTMNSAYCEELAFRYPGGSMYCPSMQTGSPATASEVTFSYAGQPLASDEHAERNFTLQVYFRPDELSPEVRQAVTEKKQNRAYLAGYFKVDTLREPVRRIVIDESKSHFCDGNFVDGAWTHSDGNCNDEVHLKTVTVLPDYITVRVDPVSTAVGMVSTDKGMMASREGR